MYYHVIVNRQVQGTYKTRESAERRADNIKGGEVTVFATFAKDPRQALQEFRDEEVRKI